jgi:hypothetical protein
MPGEAIEMVTPRTPAGRFAKAPEVETPDPAPVAEVFAPELKDEATIAPTLDEAPQDATGDPGIIADEADAIAVILETAEIELMAEILDAIACGRLSAKAIADGLRGA